MNNFVYIILTFTCAYSIQIPPGDVQFVLPPENMGYNHTVTRLKIANNRFGKIDNLNQKSKNERKLKQKEQSKNPKRKLEQKDSFEKMRNEEDLLEMAKMGTLFDINIDSIYDISKKDIKKYMKKVGSKKSNDL